MHDQFLEESLDINSFRASNVAARTTQSIGRIFRSNTDHGVVILADKGQQSWLMNPTNLSFIPYLLQQQIRLGLAIRGLIEDKKAQYPDLMEAAINGRADWDKFYNREVAKLEAEQKPKETKWGEAAARNEYDAFREMWEGRYESAAKILMQLATEAERHDPSHAAWFLHWVGVAYLHAGQPDEASGFFWQASNKKLSLGRLSSATQQVPVKNVSPGPQACRIANILGHDYRKSIDAIVGMLEGDGGKNAAEHEDGLRILGERLGFVATRPDADTGKGPDVTWALPEAKLVVAIEAKTQKESPKVYKKNKHIGKILNDCNWLEEHYKGYERRLLLVGPLCGIAPQASPPTDLRIIQITELVGLAQRLSSAALHIVARIDAKNPAPQAVENAFSHYGLLSPTCVDALDYALAADLQIENESEE